jgi:hypothetical protein
VDFAVDVQLAQATGDQLSDLAAEVNDKKAVMGCLGHGGRIEKSGVFRKIVRVFLAGFLWEAANNRRLEAGKGFKTTGQCRIFVSKDANQPESRLRAG